MTTIKEEALSELDETIEDIFYIASLLRTAGNSAAADRLGDLGDKLHDERLMLSRDIRQPVLS